MKRQKGVGCYRSRNPGVLEPEVLCTTPKTRAWVTSRAWVTPGLEPKGPLRTRGEWGEPAVRPKDFPPTPCWSVTTHIKLPCPMSPSNTAKPILQQTLSRV